MAWFKRSGQVPKARPALALERLESRTLLDASASLIGTGLHVVGSGSNAILVQLDAQHNQLVVSDGGQGIIGRFNNNAVTSINIDVTAGTGNNFVRIATNVVQGATITGALSTANDVFYAGGGPTNLIGGNGNNRLVAGPGPTVMQGGSGITREFGGPGMDTFIATGGTNLFYGVKAGDSTTPAGKTQIVTDPAPPNLLPEFTLTAAQVQTLLQRAAGASSTTAAIIAVVDRAGNPVGILVENGVQVTGNTLDFSIDGAIAEARTAAFFSNDQAPLTSRTIQFISQSTITQREVDSNPNPYVTDPTVQGPGLVAPVEIGGNFPPGVPDTPQVDLFEIELSNRDSLLGGAVPNPAATARFNIAPGNLAPGVSSGAGPGQFDANFAFPVSYGELVGHAAVNQNRGIGTLPGGIPLYETINGQTSLVGGIGVFFPGTTGYATEENSILSSTYNPHLPDLAQEAEYMAFAAAGGTAGTQQAISQISGNLPALPGFALPSGRIDLAGITLDIYGPGGTQGVSNLLKYGFTHIKPGNPNEGTFEPVNTGGTLFLNGIAPPDGNIIVPQPGVGQNGVNLTAGDVQQIINQATNAEPNIRAQIRLPLGTPARFVVAITDLNGNVIGLYRTPDATVFSIDIAVAKARNAAYYANPAQLGTQPEDQIHGVPLGAAFTGRTFRFLAEPFYPEGNNGSAPAPFSILNDGGTNLFNGLQVGPPLPVSAFQSVLGYDAFHPETNFHAPTPLANQNGIVFFPGSVPLYKIAANGAPVLVGGLGISGDGVDEDDLETFFASTGFAPPAFLRADNFFINGARLPFQQYDRNPTEL
jgi:uncharacterized protein GlcG (DUF336 family)